MSILKIQILVCMSTILFKGRAGTRDSCKGSLGFLVEKFPSTLQPAVRHVNVPSHMHCLSACLSEVSCHFLTYNGQRCKMFTKKSNDTGSDLNAISTTIHRWPERFKVHRLDVKPASSFKERLINTNHRKNTASAQQSSSTERSGNRYAEDHKKSTGILASYGSNNIEDNKYCGAVSLYNYITKSKMCVKYIKTSRVTWEEARSKCQKDGGDLVKLDTRLKYLAVYYYLKKKGLAGFGSFAAFSTGYWIGLTIFYRKGVWVDGTPMTFNKLTWWTHQNFTQCATGKRNILAKWVLHNCTMKARTFMCEKTPDTHVQTELNQR